MGRVDGQIDDTEPETAEPETAEPEADRVTPEQLCAYLSRATFGSTRGRRGYQQGEVDAFLTKLTEAVQAGQPLADLVRRQRFTPVRLEDGYEMSQVDDFLAAAVDLDPHATAAKPEVQRNGLVAKLFG
jgi:DivIVA domain-containing protein